jgi:hypothetical protein
MKYNVITYIGKTPGFIVKLDNEIYEFEWQKGLGIGGRSGEIKPEHAEKISRWRDRRGKRMFALD